MLHPQICCSFDLSMFIKTVMKIFIVCSRRFVVEKFNKHYTLYPIGSMYGMYANIWGLLMVNVTTYSIHGSCGYIKIYVYTLLPVFAGRN